MEKLECCYRKRLSKNKFEKKYSWLTYRYIYDNCIYFAKGIEFYSLCPLAYSQNSGDFRFLGILIKIEKNGLSLS